MTASTSPSIHRKRSKCEVRGIVVILIICCLIATSAAAFIMRKIFFVNRSSHASTISKNNNNNKPSPTRPPVVSTVLPTITSPVVEPTRQPSLRPIVYTITPVTADPTVSTSPPTAEPTTSPTNFPTTQPTKSPTRFPTSLPTSTETLAPSLKITGSPATSPTRGTSIPTQPLVVTSTEETNLPPSISNTTSPTTISPTNFPTLPPTMLAKVTTTGRPTLESASEETHIPSTINTTSPTTISPTDFPTSALPTIAPTAEPLPRIPQWDTFRIKIHWQEKASERSWCMECTRCNGGLIFTDQGAEFCHRVASCRPRDQIWLERCDYHRGESFSVRHFGPYDQIRIVNTNLCLERSRKHYVTVMICKNQPEQMWTSLSNHGHFEIRPATHPDKGLSYCMTQKNQPKRMEVIGLQECYKAHEYDTGYWETHFVELW